MAEKGGKYCQPMSVREKGRYIYRQATDRQIDNHSETETESQTSAKLIALKLK